MNNKVCWICGHSADSAEHMVKASDARQIFGDITQNSPIYRHSSDQPNLLVRGLRSNNIKFSSSICRDCNNSRTQPHDKAWEKLSQGMRMLDPTLPPGAIIPLKSIFRENIGRQMRNVHLYFTKLLGCATVENNAPLPVHEFALSIKTEVPHPNIRLIFIFIAPGSSRYKIQVGPIKTSKAMGRISANWYYIVGTVGVAVSYTELNSARLTRDVGWHPRDGIIIRMAK